MARTLSWAMEPPHEDEGGQDVTERERKKRDAPTLKEMRALVGELEELEERVRSRSRRMRAPSVSPDVPEVPIGPTLPPVAGEVSPSEPRASDSSPPSRDPDGGRYSFVSPPRRKKR